MYAKGTFLLDKCVASVVELGNVSTQILDEGKFTSRVLSFITIQVEYEIVEDE